MGERVSDECYAGQSRRRGIRVTLGVASGLLASLVLVPAVFAAAPTYNMVGTWTTGYRSGSTLDEQNGTWDITTMNMSTGAFSGTAEIEGTQFTLTGTESGAEVQQELTEGGYAAQDAYSLSVLSSGHVGTDNGTFNGGEFWAELTGPAVEPGKKAEEEAAKEKEAATAKEKAEKEAKEKKEKETAGKRKSAVEVTCTINVDGSKPSTCTAQVGDATGGNPVEVPTGSVKFSTTLGSFEGGDTCTLAHSSSGNTSFCVVQYAPPPGQSIIETELPIKAAYAGDSNFNPGEGAFKLKEMGIEATEFEDERINREACDALDNTTVNVDEKTGEVTIPYTAPEPGSAQAQIEGHEQIFGETGSGGFALRGSLPQTPASIADDESAAPSSPISKECEAKLALAPEGAKKASLSAPLALLAKKSSKKHKGKKGKPKGTTIAKATIKIEHAGAVKLHVRLNKAGRKLLALSKREHKHAHVTIKLQFKR